MVMFNYNSNLDILTVDREERAPEDYERSVFVGDYIIDLDSDGGFLGLELLNATQNLPYTKEELEEADKADIKLKERSGAETVTVNFKCPGTKGSFSVGYRQEVNA
ncbi:MAG: hypothetical protein SVV03_01840 [Candidatus Nanohaloarchaea archaeon]|nr:hypothetical protein [Candidatus Nanohaloarchaea archaeon]